MQPDYDPSNLVPITNDDGTISIQVPAPVAPVYTLDQLQANLAQAQQQLEGDTQQLSEDQTAVDTDNAAIAYWTAAITLATPQQATPPVQANTADPQTNQSS